MDEVAVSDCIFLFVLRGPDLYVDWDKMEGQPYAYYTYGVSCSEVELDCLTGEYRVCLNGLDSECHLLQKQNEYFQKIKESFFGFLFMFVLLADVED